MLEPNRPRAISYSPRRHGGRTRGPAPGAALIADADRDARELSAVALRRVGFEVSQAGTGARALALARSQRPQIAVLEVRLPDMSGVELAARLREEPGAPIRVLFTSCDRTEPMDCVAGLLLGADDYLVKPVDPDELLARTRAVLRRATSQSLSA